jgi:hypothetical protein
MKSKRIKILGAYLLAISSLQMCLYLAMWRSPEQAEWLFHFDPRFGIFFLETFMQGRRPSDPTFFRCLSAIWIFLIGLLLFLGRSIVKTYVASELILLLPNACFFLIVIWANQSPTHGFSIAELFFPLLVMLLFSFVPLWLAWQSRSKADATESKT